MLDRNDIATDDLIFIIFTATDDITAEFPAAAVRKIGLSHIPVICARELAVEGALPFTIRALMLAYIREGARAAAACLPQGRAASSGRTSPSRLSNRDRPRYAFLQGRWVSTDDDSDERRGQR